MFGGKSIDDMSEVLKSRIDDLQQSHPEFEISYQQLDLESNCPLILTIVTPLMKRVHEQV